MARSNKLLGPSDPVEAQGCLCVATSFLEVAQILLGLDDEQRAIWERGEHGTPDSELQRVFSVFGEFGTPTAIPDCLESALLMMAEARGLFPNAERRIQTMLEDAQTITWPRLAIVGPAREPRRS